MSPEEIRDIELRTGLKVKIPDEARTKTKTVH